MSFEEFIKNEKIALSYQSSVGNVISEILSAGFSFSVVTNIEYITFEPTLPEEIQSVLNDITLFALDGYTLSSAYIENDTLFFEAGFGNENFGSVVNVPLGAIMQVLIEETPVFINPCEKPDEKSDKKLEKSMNVFLSNPNNKKHLD